MEKIGKYYQSRYDGEVSRKKKMRSPCMQKPPRNPKSNLVWVPTVPRWEKEFCHKVGQFTWDNFLNAKKANIFEEKIMRWNDSAGEEAFNNAKSRYYAEINGLPMPDDQPLPDPDMYIDEVVDSKYEIDPVLLHELEMAKLVDDQDENMKECIPGLFHDVVPDWYNVRMEDIKPSGWDVVEDVAEKGLTGLVIECVDQY